MVFMSANIWAKSGNTSRINFHGFKFCNYGTDCGANSIPNGSYVTKHLPVLSARSVRKKRLSDGDKMSVSYLNFVRALVLHDSNILIDNKCLGWPHLVSNA